jgi:hypothetical protein
MHVRAFDKVDTEGTAIMQTFADKLLISRLEDV